MDGKYGEVVKGLVYVTDARGADECMELSRGEVSAVVTVGGEWLQPESVREACRQAEIGSCVLALDDEVDADLLAVLPRVVRFVRRQIKRRDRTPKHRVVVHCLAGVSRSVAVCIALSLVLRVSPTPISALQTIKQTWPRARPNAGFMRQLEQFARAGAPTQFSTARSNALNRSALGWTFEEHVHRLIGLRRWRRMMYLTHRHSCDSYEQLQLPPHLLALNAEHITMSRRDCERLIPLRSFCSRCRRCRYILCGHDHIIYPACTNSAFAQTSSDLRLVAVAWMREQISVADERTCWNSQGRLNCPRCGSKVGAYEWRDKQRFSIHSSHLDDLPLFTLHQKSIDSLSLQPKPPQQKDTCQDSCRL